MTERRSATGYLLTAALVLIAAEFLINTKVEASSSSWWSLGLFGCDVNHRNKCLNCAAMKDSGFTTQAQEEECMKDSTAVRSVARGARYAILDCQRRFNASKWNCSTFQDKHIFGKFIDGNTKETALLHSYMIAGATWALATDCQRQKLKHCQCNRIGEERIKDEETGDLIFYECNANVDYALTYLNSFVLDNERRGGSLRGQLDWSNGQVGYNAAKLRQTSCRCHGISGTCSSQTCYLKVRSVEEVGEELVEKIEEAVKVDDSATINTTDGSNINTLKYQKDSPNFCTRNDSIGVLGVQGRPCELDHLTHNCESLCCDRGYEATTEVIAIEECKFEWCCYVKCRHVRDKRVAKFHCK